LKEKERAFIKAITAMEDYSQHSFEELRFFCSFRNKTTEVLTAKPASELGDHRYTATWIPKFPGNYNIKMEIDGILAEEINKVTVIDAGTPPPPEIQMNRKNSIKKKVKKFIIKSSAGLRIRIHPTTQSPDVGIIKFNETVSYVDEVRCQVVYLKNGCKF
jgi:RCR-type E3 ubiquitin transferase